MFEIPAGPLAHRQQLFSRACNFENLLVRWASNFFQAFFPSHHTYCRLSQVYGLLVLTGTFDRKQQQPNLFSTKKKLPSGQDIRHGPIRLYCSWPLPKKQTKRQSIWNTGSRGKRVDATACRKRVVTV